MNTQNILITVQFFSSVFSRLITAENSNKIIKILLSILNFTIQYCNTYANREIE